MNLLHWLVWALTRCVWTIIFYPFKSLDKFAVAQARWEWKTGHTWNLKDLL